MAHIHDGNTNNYNISREKYGVEISPSALFFNEIGVLLSEKLIDSLFGGVIVSHGKGRSHAHLRVAEENSTSQDGVWDLNISATKYRSFNKRKSRRLTRSA
jgi:hypothetical protein